MAHLRITTSTLTPELVASLRDWCHPNGDGLDPNLAMDRLLAFDIRTWLAWSAEQRGQHEHGSTAKSLTSALNYRSVAQ